MAEQTDKIRDQAKEKFSDEEITEFINMGKTLASKSVLTALMYVIEDGKSKGCDPAEADRLKERITALMPVNFCGYTEVEITGMDIKLRIQLTICEQDYKTAIDVPDDPAFIKDLYGQYGFLKKTATIYWKQFCEEQPLIYKRICHYRKDIDFNELVIDPTNPTTLYFDPECSRRIGIFCYYVDKSGNPFKKVGKK